jgi:nucleoside-diphosphate-sugar epimerase
LRILILGSEGFIGSHFVEYFLAHNHVVSGIDLFEQPTRRYLYTKVSRLSPELDELFEKNTFDAVINAAGSGNVPYSMSHPVIDFEANSLDTIRVVESIRKHQKVCKYIHISSAAVYGNPIRLPVKEDDATAPLSPYGWHKLIAEHICREYSTVYNLPIAIVRPFSVYGTGLKKQLFWDLFQKIKNCNGNVELHGTGKESRDFIHVKDLVKAVALILEKGSLTGEVYNLASGEETTIANVVKMFVSTLKEPPICSFNGVVRSGDPLNWCADMSKLQELHFVPDYKINDGMQEISTWLQSL